MKLIILLCTINTQSIKLLGKKLQKTKHFNRQRFTFIFFICNVIYYYTVYIFMTHVIQY